MGLRDEADGRWVGSRLTDHPARTLDQPLPPMNPVAAAVSRTYILCPDPEEPAPLAAFAERARAGNWRYHELPAGHDAMVSAPQELVTLLVEFV